jgi:hypothetical protein
MKKSLADNHLSELASKGRHGDTDIARTSEGKLWHVNPAEKALIGMMGKEGEKLVDAVGSGTTNPETGLEEKWVMAALTAGQLALSTYSAISGQSAEKDKARLEIEGYRDQLNALNRQEEVLHEGKKAKIGANMAEHQMEVGNLSAQTGIAEEDLNKQTETAIKKSGLATSGTITGKQSQMWNRIMAAFGRGKKSLMASLGSKMGEVEGWFESQKSTISANRATLNQQLRFAKKREQSGWFG